MKTLYDFGAIGDGLTDDTAAIQAAMNAEKHIYVPEGVFKTTASVDQNDCLLHGIHKEVSKIQLANPAVNAFNMKGGLCGSVGVGVLGAAVDESANSWAFFSDAASAPNEVVFDEYGVRGFNNGIKLEASVQKSIVKDGLIDELKGFSSNFGYGVLNASSNFLFDGNEINGDAANNHGRHAIYNSVEAKYGKVRRNIVRSFKWAGITSYAYQHQNGVSDIDIEYNDLYDCVQNNSTAWHDGALSVFGKCKDMNIRYNNIYNSGGNGLHFATHGEADFSGFFSNGNFIQNSAMSGVMSKGLKQSQFVNDVIMNSSRLSANTYSNFFIAGDWSHNMSTEDVNILGLTSIGDGNVHSPLYVNPSAPLAHNVDVIDINYNPNHFAGGVVMDGDAASEMFPD